MKKIEYYIKKNVIACIIPVDNSGFVGFLLTKFKNHFNVFWNTKAKIEINVENEILTNFPFLFIQKNSKEVENNQIIIDWAKKISDINHGIDQDTSMIPLDLFGYTPKQKQVIEVVHTKITVGTYVSYGEVASLAGLPNAQRFVGTTMKHCRQPWIIPVQRVKNAQFMKKLHKTVIRSMPI